MSPTSASLYLAVPLAMGAALSFGATGVIQHQATQQVPARGPLRPRLLLDLARQPLWLASIGLTLLGFALQVLALRFGPLVLVQPLLVTGLLFCVLIGARLRRRRPDRIMLAGSVLTVAGLTSFLLGARPTPGSIVLTSAEVVPLAIGLAVVVAGCVLFAVASRGNRRALALALATGVLYGLTAGLVKLVTVQTRQGLTEPFVHWPLYLVLVVGPIAFLLNENAFQAGPLAAPPLAVITTTDPLTGIAIGLLWLGERIDTSAPALAAEAVGLIATVAGIAALAQRTPALAAQLDDTRPRP